MCMHRPRTKADACAWLCFAAYMTIPSNSDTCKHLQRIRSVALIFQRCSKPSDSSGLRHVTEHRSALCCTMRASGTLCRLVHAASSSAACAAGSSAPLWAAATLACSADAQLRCSSTSSSQAPASPATSGSLRAVTQLLTATGQPGASTHALPQIWAVSHAPHRRRFTALAEQCAEAAQQDLQAAEQPGSRQRRRLPSMDEVRERLQSGGGAAAAACSSASGPPQRQDGATPAADGETLDWRRLLAAIRRGQQAQADESTILTDTFQCAPLAGP